MTVLDGRSKTHSRLAIGNFASANEIFINGRNELVCKDTNGIKGINILTCILFKF